MNTYLIPTTAAYCYEPYDYICFVYADTSQEAYIKACTKLQGEYIPLESQEYEIPKYKKPKKSNISKSNYKSKHKHQYKECLIQYSIVFAGKTFINTKLYGYCFICGKIGSVKNGKYKAELEQLEKSRQGNNSFLIAISGEEIYERYHNKLPIFYIEDPFANYVVLERENNTENNSKGE